ncbi:MAG: ubiquinone/menaquinone biosynthesis methyltransferase [Deltaproteobacteria bacterium]|nr:ubiquinone/menaquinone biosynthesis methyltransferase [Deltaproteobacteria bacterium]
MNPTEHDIAGMFDLVSGRYDLLNHVLSGYTDVRWRKKAIGMSLRSGVKDVLDVSTGTGDMAIGYERAGSGVHVYGLDISMEMLRIARTKAGLGTGGVRLIRGSGLSLPFRDGTFDLVSCAFGIRNIYPREQGIREFYRVLRPGGGIAILEFSMPPGAFGRIYRLYFDRVLPLLGNLISGTRAYTYLTSSVRAFPVQATFTRMLASEGFRDIEITALTHGIAALYSGKK